MSNAPQQCQCSLAGFCAAFNRQMVGRPYEICQGRALTPEQQQAYRAKWWRERETGPPPAPMQPAPIPCVYRGERLEKIDCGCTVDLYTYECRSGENPDGQCTLRKVERKAGQPKIDLPNCLDCRWREETC